MVASAAALDAALPRIYINAQVGRAMVAGLAVIQTLVAQGELRHYVVVGLGTNGPVSAAQIRQLRRLIGPNRDLILINTFGPMPWESSVNSVLDAAARHTAHVSLADWHAAIADHTGLLWPDGIHPQPSGAKVYARVVLAAIQAQLPHASAPLCGRPVSGPRLTPGLYHHAARGYGDGCGAVCGGRRDGEPARLSGGADQFRGPGPGGGRGRHPARSVPAGDGDRPGGRREDPAGRRGSPAGGRPVR
jgi:hypothetical protein